MTHKLKTSLIITTYNWPEALALTLQSVIRQSKPPDEVIIADDGSGAETEKAFEILIKQLPARWRHIRHNDHGIRQARVKNLGVRYSKGDYLIFIDHDVVLHKDFVFDHINMAEKRVLLQGKRSFLPEYYTNKWLAEGLYGQPNISTPGLKNRKNALRLPRLGKTLSRLKKFQTSLRGCNLSMFREDFLGVDGYDETFDQLWGREDSDICYRSFHSGIRIKNLWFSALQYHLHHEVSKNRKRDRLDRELDQVVQEKRTKAILGFSKLSTEGEIIAESH